MDLGSFRISTVNLLEEPARTVNPILLAVAAALISQIVWVSATPYGMVILPGGLIFLAFCFWSYRRPVVALSTIILLNLHLLEESEEITPLEILVGIYFFGFLGFWFWRKIFVDKERVARGAADAFLLIFLAYCFFSGILVIALGKSISMWFREFLTVSNILLYFPLRDIIGNRKTAITVLVVFFLFVLVVAVNNLIEYRSASAAAEQMWELISGRTSFGDHLFFPTVVLLASLWKSDHLRFRRMLIVLSILVFGISLALTFSRGFWLGAVIGILVVFWLGSREEKWKLIHLMILVGILATTALFAYAGDLAEYIIDALVLRLGTATSVMQDLSVRERIAESSAAVTMIAQSPLVGHGLGAELRHFHTIDLWTKSSLFIHNGYLFLLFKVGILGTMIFLCFFLLTCLKAVQLSRTLPRGFPRAAIQGFSGVLIAMLFVTITSNVFISKESLLVIAIASAIVSAHAIVQEEERMRSSSVASPQF